MVDSRDAVQKHLIGRHLEPRGSRFFIVSIILSVLTIAGIVGFVLRFQDGFGQGDLWGYYVALFAFIFAAAGGAPMVAISTRIAKAHWPRSISRISELFSIVSLFGIILFIPMIWILPDMEDGRRTLWFFGKLNVPSNLPHILTTLGLVSLVLTGLFMLWLSLMPDIRFLRDMSNTKKGSWLYNLSAGWIGSSRQWFMQRHRIGILGAFYFMTLIFVHFLIAVDFSMTLVPGWIDALYPVTQAHNSLQVGVATVVLTMFAVRYFGHYQDYLTIDQFRGLGKLMFALSLLWFWFWFSSFIVLWYGAKPSEKSVLELLMTGPYIWVFIAAFVLLFVVPLFTMIWNPLRRSIWGPTIIAGCVFIGAILDKIRIYVASYSVIDQAGLHEIEHVPSTIWPGFADILIWIGGLAGCVLVYMLATRILPVINIWEQKELKLYQVHKKFHRIEVQVLGKPE